MTETELSKAIKDALEEFGFMVERVPAGQYKGAGGHRVHVASKGFPDLVVVGLGFIEVKRPGGKLSPAQVEWHEKALRRGARVATVTSWADAVAVCMAWRGGR